MESIKEAWSGVLHYLHEQNDISDVAYKTWIQCIEPQTVEGNVVVLKVHTDFQRGIIQSQYSEKISEAFLQVLGIRFELRIVSEEAPVTETESAPQVANIFGQRSSDYEYTFENFVVGPSNKFAHAAAQAVGLNPAGAYNPLFIYGGSGLGKTHLLFAICNEIKKNKPDTYILYVKGEDLTNELVVAINNHTMPKFRDKYRKADVLLIDDIQFIAGKPQTQDEFFHTFDALHQANKQIVLASDRPPREIATLEERLRTRFEMGLLADIQPPDLETRIAIVKRKAQLLNMPISDEICEYLASQLKSNVRQLEGAVRRMQAQYLLEGETPTRLTAQNAIRDIRTNNQPVPITVERIINEVARTMSVTPEDIRSKKHTANISAARQVAEYVVHEITALSMKNIGEEFGGRDHTSVVYAIQKVKERMENEASFKNLLNDIIKNLSET